VANMIGKAQAPRCRSGFSREELLLHGKVLSRLKPLPRRRGRYCSRATSATLQAGIGKSFQSAPEAIELDKASWGGWRAWLGATLAGERPAYTHVVPLGLSCRVTHHVRRYFGIGIAYPFDWWISPLPGLASYLADPDPDRIYAPGCLEEMHVDGRAAAIRNVEFGIELYHEFPRTRVCVEGREVSVVAPDWRDYVAAARQKHAARLKRLLAIDRPGNRILFVRNKYDADGVGRANARELAALTEQLRARWPAADVELLLVNVPVQGRLPRGVRSVTFQDLPGPPPDEWHGSSELWRAAFSAQRLRLDGQAHVDAPLQWSSGPPD